ncbi:MAG: hypothetical protein IPP77_15895 [Bacteroidetes bacterium]|nr:hypothetical protein [Bacteroidota bacterium]
MRRIFILLFLVAGLLSVNNLAGQERSLGTWKMYLPYQSSLGICDAGDRVYCASTNGVFSFDKTTNVIQIYDKSNSLSDVSIKTIAYDPATKALVVAYNNSNLDLIFDGTDVYNITDIKVKSVTGAILIYDISFYNGFAYLSTNIGITVINLAKKEISNTYVIGANGASISVFSTTIDGTHIYAATSEGVKRAPLSAPNLLDFNSWTLFDMTQNLPKKSASLIEAYQNKIYTVIGGGGTDTLFEYDGTNWQKKYFAPFQTFKALDAVNGTLYFAVWVDSLDKVDGKIGKIESNGTLSIRPSYGHLRPGRWFESIGISWESDFYTGFYINPGGDLQRILPEGPFSSSVFDIEIKNGVVYVASGGVNDSWGFNWIADGFSIYENGTWTVRNKYTDLALANYTDIICAAPVPARDVTYFGSFLSGLIEYRHATQEVVTYDKNNSILEGASGDTQRTKISCLFVDQESNVWIGNAGAPSAIKMIRNDGTWKKFSLPYSIEVVKRILVDQRGQIWALTRQQNGVVVFSYGNDIDNPADDSYRLIRSGAGDGGLPDENVYCIAEDQNGNIWVGTNQGIGIFYCAGSILTQSGCEADQIKVERDGYIGYLFGTEAVRAIAVDAANRKWIGTNNGVWLISADGKTELLRFTSENSPLPTNQITDIAIDAQTGEVFIGTTGGLVSYQGDAIAECNDCDGALVYPNPVKPEYDGPIAIKGLTSNAYVKITDVAGTLIYQGKANGTQMIWDGKNYNGTRAKSGVYLVFSSTDLGKERRVAKILLAN